MKIILASKSPRRREILSMSGLSFGVMTKEIDEEKITSKILSEGRQKSTFELSETITRNLAYEKGKEIYRENKDSVVISSDTLVVDEIGILGKPKNKIEAENMLKRLSGKVHRVYTSVAIFGGKVKDFDIFTEVAEVKFYDYDDSMKKIIDSYVDSGSPLDKAGGYGIQDSGGLLVECINGDYYTIVGLPFARLYRRLMARL